MNSQNNHQYMQAWKKAQMSTQNTSKEVSFIWDWMQTNLIQCNLAKAQETF